MKILFDILYFVFREKIIKNGIMGLLFFIIGGISASEYNEKDDLYVSNILTKAIVLSSMGICSTSLIEYLLIDCPKEGIVWLNFCGRTPLEEACALGNIDIVKVLLKKNVVNDLCVVDRRLKALFHKKNVLKKLFGKHSEDFWGGFSKVEQVLVAKVICNFERYLDVSPQINIYKRPVLTGPDIEMFYEHLLNFLPVSAWNNLSAYIFDWLDEHLIYDLSSDNIRKQSTSL
ncbi:MAG: hypothetical protein UR26_C0002G0231 [candidate division TM6 bacterium GW2011_GWF2_32_72]|nr:MAG: hypothetical protein UR26_C0002G0231 [candidate division TM6 bacterium GW2011_GWF2_32_72]